jgi:sugar lactone lactonase YvrE
MSLQVVAEGYTFLEGPRWHQGRLWTSDFYTHQVVAISPADGRAEVMAHVPAQPSGIGFLPDGRALIVSMRDRKVLRREASGELVVHADLSKLAPWHCNDMIVDAKGRAYVGNFGWDLMSGAPPASTCLVRVDPDGRAGVAAEGLMFPNGCAITPDGRTLIVAESFGGRLTAFDVAPDGSLSRQRVWARLGDVPTVFHGDIPDTVALPDGICLDAEGAVWYADGIRQCVVRVAEGGRELDRISTAPLGVYACMLGGDDGRTLFMCAAPNFLEDERKATREGRILAARVKVPHAGLP